MKTQMRMIHEREKEKIGKVFKKKKNLLETLKKILERRITSSFVIRGKKEMIR